MNEIVEIAVEKIKPNPANPRLDLGDLTELAASIRENGIMQNLTVVKDEEDGYMAVIGHRRLAAAKLAELETVPCQIKNLTPKEQMCIMLAENIQRNSLTPYEQAQGFQMYMNLGADISEIVEKTGFSESTVRHRLKLAELDQDVLKEKSGEQILMKDYIKLEEIKDVELRNEALKNIGTSDFAYSVRYAKEEEKKRVVREELIKKLDAFAIRKTREEIDAINLEGTKCTCCASIYLHGAEQFEAPEDADEKTYYYVMTGSDYPTANLYCESDEPEPAEPEPSPEAEAQMKAVSEIDEILKIMGKTRNEFIENLTEAQCEEKSTDIIREMIILNEVAYMDPHMSRALEEVCGLDEFSDDAEEATRQIAKAVKGREYKTLVCAIYHSVNPSEYARTTNRYGQYCENEDFNDTYRFIKMLGYKPSSTEIQILDGTHPAYYREGDHEEE